MWPGKQDEPSLEETKKKPLEGTGSLEGELVQVPSRSIENPNGMTNKES